MNYQPKIIKSVSQGSPEWTALRLGRVGGSEAEVFTVNGKGPYGLGEGAKTMAMRKVAEKYFGDESSTYQGDAMIRGTMMEMEARVAVEEKLGIFIDDSIGYIEYGPHFGYSPDGVAEEGLIEIKCPLGPEIVRLANMGQIKKEHMAQMQWGMMITGFQRCYYCAYHPMIKANPIIIEVPIDAAIVAQMHEKAAAYETLFQQIEAKVKELL